MRARIGYATLRAEGHLFIVEALSEATAALRAAGLEAPRLDAEVLLAHALGVSRAYLVAHPDEPLLASVQDAYQALVARRVLHEPVAYLTGRRAWYDLELRVTPAVLVPRPETEGLLERALAWARGHHVGAVVDVGTGSGALASALASALPETTIYATDVSDEALALAHENAAHNGAERVTFLRGDLLAPLPGPVDLIVANLPYIGEDEYSGLMPDVRLYEPRLALVGGAGGHELTERLLAQAPAYLRPGGAILVEIGPPQAQAVQQAAHTHFPRAAIRVEDDLAGLARYLLVETGP